jgi:hypothetical protein
MMRAPEKVTETFMNRDGCNDLLRIAVRVNGDGRNPLAWLAVAGFRR